MNVSETGWRIILRPLRTILASMNVSRRLWPFAINHTVRVHNALSSSSLSIEHDSDSITSAFLASLSSIARPPPPSPYYLVTGRPADLEWVRVLFCKCEVRIRNPDDLRKRFKTDPVTCRACNLGPDSRKVGVLVYLFDQQRFTCAAYRDVVMGDRQTCGCASNTSRVAALRC